MSSVINIDVLVIGAGSAGIRVAIEVSNYYRTCNAGINDRCIWSLKKPFSLLTEALDQLEKDEIYIASGGTMRCAYWGEILTVSAKRRGATGAIIDSFQRDTPMILKHSWSVFSRGRYAQDSSVRSKVADYRCPIEIGKVWINPGDLVFVDLDGVLIIPREIEEKIIHKSLDKSRTEKLVLEEIKKGMTSTEAFKRYGVL